jgi:hypothetical protein
MIVETADRATLGRRAQESPRSPPTARLQNRRYLIASPLANSCLCTCARAHHRLEHDQRLAESCARDRALLRRSRALPYHSALTAIRRFNGPRHLRDGPERNVGLDQLAAAPASGSSASSGSSANAPVYHPERGRPCPPLRYSTKLALPYDASGLPIGHYLQLASREIYLLST